MAHFHVLQGKQEPLTLIKPGIKLLLRNQQGR